jgi:hypothetical protein
MLWRLTNVLRRPKHRIRVRRSFFFDVDLIGEEIF